MALAKTKKLTNKKKLVKTNKKTPLLLDDHCAFDKNNKKNSAVLSARHNGAKWTLPASLSAFNFSKKEKVFNRKELSCAGIGKPDLHPVMSGQGMNALENQKKSFWQFSLSPRKSFWLGVFFGIAFMSCLMVAFWALFSAELAMAFY